MLPRLPAVPPVPAPANGPRLVALRDRPFLAFTVLDGLMSMHFRSSTSPCRCGSPATPTAPPGSISVLPAGQHGMVVLLFQVRASRGTEDLTGAARASRRAGVAASPPPACCSRPAAAYRPRRRWRCCSAGALVHVVGELWHSAAGWGISFGLAPAHAQGQYQGAYGMGFAARSMVAPVLVTTLALGWGVPGWLVLGVVFLLLGRRCRRWCAGPPGPGRPRAEQAAGAVC